MYLSDTVIFMGTSALTFDALIDSTPPAGLPEPYASWWEKIPFESHAPTANVWTWRLLIHGLSQHTYTTQEELLQLLLTPEMQRISAGWRTEDTAVDSLPGATAVFFLLEPEARGTACAFSGNPQTLAEVLCQAVLQAGRRLHLHPESRTALSHDLPLSPWTYARQVFSLPLGEEEVAYIADKLMAATYQFSEFTLGFAVMAFETRPKKEFVAWTKTLSLNDEHHARDLYSLRYAGAYPLDEDFYRENLSSLRLLYACAPAVVQKTMQLTFPRYTSLGIPSGHMYTNYPSELYETGTAAWLKPFQQCHPHLMPASHALALLKKTEDTFSTWSHDVQKAAWPWLQGCLSVIAYFYPAPEEDVRHIIRSLYRAQYPETESLFDVGAALSLNNRELLALLEQTTHDTKVEIADTVDFQAA